MRLTTPLPTPAAILASSFPCSNRSWVAHAVELARDGEFAVLERDRLGVLGDVFADQPRPLREDAGARDALVPAAVGDQPGGEPAERLRVALVRTAAPTSGDAGGSGPRRRRRRRRPGRGSALLGLAFAGLERGVWQDRGPSSEARSAQRVHHPVSEWLHRR